MKNEEVKKKRGMQPNLIIQMNKLNMVFIIEN
jgi:hypothetical protein